MTGPSRRYLVPAVLAVLVVIVLVTWLTQSVLSRG
jgi:hypothetical protein